MTNPQKTLPNARAFNQALRTVLQVSKTDLNQMMAEEKHRKKNSGKLKPGPKPKHTKSGL